MAEKDRGKTKRETTPEEFPVSSPQSLPSGDYSYTLEVVMGMQATLGQLTEAINGLKEQSKSQGQDLKAIGLDVHAGKILLKVLLWVVGLAGALLGIALTAFMKKWLSGSP